MTDNPQKNSRHFIVTFGLILVAVSFIVLLSVGLSFDPKKIPVAILDKQANPFRVAWIQGQEFLPEAKGTHFNLADYRGKPLVLNFWASWCVSCRQEALELEGFWQQYKDSGVMVVGIAIQDEVDAAKKFAKYYGKTYILGLDEDGKAAIDYGVSGVPESFLIDRNGVIKHKEVGPVSVKMLEKMLPKIM
jgi:cytochrome c biogenesis protein CcmG, thiol:disulfide interchange protein DsbE